ncbi:MAG: hypothetical protein M1818_003333 [Claussenomyces sp. TS43310]|nr:MAG: hypothetical protein M1818_003333 [Claussenomyces sp. TS43310]
MQGFNMGKYVPPEYEGVYSHNQISKKHPLGSRANKSSQGILTVRFEMPYPIWCTHCPKPTVIGQGVRFNAEKKKVGNYHSTPIFSFRMKHVACGGWIEIRTDPKNTAYIVTEGARKRDTGEDKVEEGDIKILTEEEREALRNNAFASLEGKVEDKRRLEGARQRLEELQDVQDAQWDDPYEQNRRLRKSFRVDRKEREQDARVAGALQDKMSLGIELLPESKDDATKASFVSFGADDASMAISKAISKPLFAMHDPPPTLHPDRPKMTKKAKAEELVQRRKADLAAAIRGNTRAKMDPFLATKVEVKQKRKDTLGIKRKREDKCGSLPSPGDLLQDDPRKAVAKGLVDYDSE